MLTAAHIQDLKPVVAIVGPTAIGKSRVSIHVARAFDTDVLTADSRQVYRGMDIGTDKPTLAERQGVRHRLIDVVNPDEHFSVGAYRRHATADIAALHAEGKLPIIAGGTGLYVRALLRGLWEGPPADWPLRRELSRQARIYGDAYVHAQLAQVDPRLAQHVHPHDTVKVQRGLEVFHALGIPLSEVHDRHQYQDAPYRSHVIGLTMAREHLYRRIEDRVHLEIDKGLIDETRRLLNQGYHRELSSMKSLGYRQMAGLLAGDYDYGEAVRVLKRDTRHFAKRQITWFRKEPGMTWLTITPSESAAMVAERIVRHIQAVVPHSPAPPSDHARDRAMRPLPMSPNQ